MIQPLAHILTSKPSLKRNFQNTYGISHKSFGFSLCRQETSCKDVGYDSKGSKAFMQQVSSA